MLISCVLNDVMNHPGTLASDHLLVRRGGWEHQTTPCIEDGISMESL